MNELQKKIFADIEFINDKIEDLRLASMNKNTLDIKQMADYHRYAETRLFLVETLVALKEDR